MPTLLPWITLVSVLLLVASLLWQRRVQQVRQSHRYFEQSREVCRQLLLLIAQLQQHRGMSTAWLAGDAGFASRLREKQAEIEQLLPPLLLAARREGERTAPCFTGNDLSLFGFRWHSLIESLAGKKPEESIVEHNALIAQVLDWLAALGEARIEPAAATPEGLGLARNYAHRLPALAECLGQARAVGSGVAARQGCSPVARVRLLFLIGRAEALLEQAASANDGGRVTIQARAAVREMAATVRGRLLLGAGVGITPQAYFAMATQAIDAVYAWVDRSGLQLQELAGTSAGPDGRSSVLHLA